MRRGTITPSAHRVLVAETAPTRAAPADWLADLVAIEKAAEAALRAEAKARGVTLTAIRKEVRIARRALNRSDR